MCCHLHVFNSFALEPLLVEHSKLKVLFTSMVGENIPATDVITENLRYLQSCLEFYVRNVFVVLWMKSYVVVREFLY